MNKPATLYPGKRCLTEIVGFEPVTAEQAASCLAELGFTTVEMPNGIWLAGWAALLPVRICYTSTDRKRLTKIISAKD